MAHRRSCLVESVIGGLPVEDPYLHQVEQHIIGHHLPIQRQEILMGADHVDPKEIIVMEIQEAVAPPPLLDHELVMSFLSRKMSPVGAPVKDLEGNQSLVSNDRTLMTLPLEH